MRALLATLANPRDGEAVVGLLAGGLGGVSDDGLYLLTRAADRPRTACGERSAPQASSGSVPRTNDGAGWFARPSTRLRAEQGRMRLADMLLDAAAALGPGGGCLARDGAWANLRKAARLAAEFERTAQADPAAFLHHLEEREAFVKREAAAGVARGGRRRRSVVMTVHAAKGLEFPVVAVGRPGTRAPAARDTLVVVEERRGRRSPPRGCPRPSATDCPCRGVRRGARRIAPCAGTWRRRSASSTSRALGPRSCSSCRAERRLAQAARESARDRLGARGDRRPWRRRRCRGFGSRP